MKDVEKKYENVISGGLKLKGKIISKSNKKIIKPIKTEDSKEFLTIPNEPQELTSKSDLQGNKLDVLNQRIEKVKSDVSLTSSEKAFKIAQIKRTYKRIEQSLKESHREKIEKFNNKLSKLSEHFDIPKVGPG
ncbi:hypothetical protein TpMuguga_03g00818 [Theileria parva strain Muguga]|uniref:Uncharacterized protein n=1 Tax=Theileria parva TaxID=5875 RepID=Q4MYM3_THEPA|nr:uncharacterized protein TpMuguga_03g00818 [Theileria parva strain Muguga]EAN30659.1 hypothetical protein TpMuguga_03g00818 [Theileria parva strain Muguga]|eukprot:XP_762942.1 hypothetical protein [Theileria parva strain Muguga]